MADIGGYSKEPFGSLPDVLSELIDSGHDRGASVAVTIDGEMVTDIWGGWADPERTRPWERDTIVNVWSTTKTMTALAALTLVDRGLLDVDAPVARYWPEFAQNGKEGVLVRHVLGHTSGVSGWDQPITVQDVCDLAGSTARLAAQAPWWEPGSASGYHALNQGHLVGELVRRIDGRTLGRYFADEIAGPLGADFHIGLAPEHHDRVAPVTPPPPLGDQLDLSAVDAESPMIKTFTGPVADAAFANDPAWRTTEIGAANGHGNARSVARVQSVVANHGTVDGITLLSPETVDVIFREQANGVDQVLGVPITFGIGYGLPRPDTFPYLPQRKVCFWGGWGGSMIIVDVDRRMTIAYMMNQMASGIVGGPSGTRIITAVYDALGDTTRA